MGGDRRTWPTVLAVGIALACFSLFLWMVL